MAYLHRLFAMTADDHAIGWLIGTAGWSIPTAVSSDVPGEGTHLQRYAARFDVVEINSSFYRPHRRSTYERWAASVPSHFRFSVKVPKSVTHQHKLVDCRELLAAFADQVDGLGSARGPSLVQLPPSLVFDAEVAKPFFELASAMLGNQIVCEPRHPSWFDALADLLLAELGVARVAASPAIGPEAARPGGWNGLAYFRLHGTPAMYRSSYEQEALEQQRDSILGARAAGAQCWTIFDNTASGAAMPNALQLVSMAGRR